MKSFAVFMKSPVGKLHSAFALFILFNLISGFVDLFIHFTPWLVALHFYTGLMIVIAPLAYLCFAKNRRIILKAFSRMILPAKAELAKGKPLTLVFKAVTLLAALLIAVNAVSGILMKFRLMLPVESYNIHVFDFKALLALVPLHAVLAAVSRGSHSKKSASARQNAKPKLNGLTK